MPINIERYLVRKREKNTGWIVAVFHQIEKKCVLILSKYDNIVVGKNFSIRWGRASLLQLTFA